MQDIKKKPFHFSYKVEDWNIFMKINVVYMCIPKQKYVLKNI